MEGIEGAYSNNNKPILEKLIVKTAMEVPKSNRHVSWVKPPVGWLILNVDGSCQGNPDSNGGFRVIWD